MSKSETDWPKGTRLTASQMYDLLDKKVAKASGKTFKSGRSIETVMGFQFNPATGEKAFVLGDDNYLVDMYKCKLVEE